MENPQEDNLACSEEFMSSDQSFLSRSFNPTKMSATDRAIIKQRNKIFQNEAKQASFISEEDLNLRISA